MYKILWALLPLLFIGCKKEESVKKEEIKDVFLLIS